MSLVYFKHTEKLINTRAVVVNNPIFMTQLNILFS